MIRTFVDNLAKWDIWLFYTIFNRNGKRLLDRVMILISRSADGYYYALIAFFLYLFAPEMAKPFVVAGIMAYALEAVAYGFIKKKIKRDRPFQAMPDIQYLLIPPDRFSFPSGHTAGAFVMAVLIAAFQPALVLPVFIWASAVAISRVYLGVHYPSDVLAGMVLGTACAKIGILVFFRRL